METIYRAYKYRIYPNEEQKVLIHKHIGSCRWLYNYALEKKVKAYKKDGTRLSRFQLSADLPKLKKNKQTEWLKEVNSQSLQMSLKNLDEAFTRFFRDKKGFPRFKSKNHPKKTFSVPQSIKVDWENKRISIPKIKNMRFVVNRKPDGVIKSAVVSRTPTNKYFISILVDTGMEPPKKHEIRAETAIGVDLGIKDFLITSNGEKVDNPKYLKNHLFKLKKLQRRASKKQKGSQHRRKANLRVAKRHERITNLRTDFLHKVSSRLISENQTICLEDLNVQGMMKNHKLAQSIQDCSWSKFNEFLEYKAEWNGVNIVRIGRFKPSSKMCSKCGWIKRDLTLKDRKWKCSECGVAHDRDINAAQNIKDFGLLKNNLIGAGRPKSKPLENTLSKRGSVKEETQLSLAVG